MEHLKWSTGFQEQRDGHTDPSFGTRSLTFAGTWRRGAGLAVARRSCRDIQACIDADSLRCHVNLDDMLDRCCALETRSAALYRSFAAAAHEQPDLCALWTAMAHEEDDHARILNDTRRHLPTIDAWVTQLSTRWDEVVRRVEEKLSRAERLTGDAGADKHLIAAIELETSEIESLRHMLVTVSRRRVPPPIAESHVLRLADAAERFCAQPEVRQQAALLRARAQSHPS